MYTGEHCAHRNALEGAPVNLAISYDQKKIKGRPAGRPFSYVYLSKNQTAFGTGSTLDSISFTSEINSLMSLNLRYTDAKRT